MKSYLLNFIFCLIGIQGVAQSPYIKQYTDVEGVPGMVVYQVLQDDNGLIWLATDNGIAYFDGKKFTKVTHPKMANQDFIGLYKAPTGRIWFWNWFGQAFYLNKNKLEYYSPNGFLDSIPIISLFTDKKGNVFLSKKIFEGDFIYCDTDGNCESRPKIKSKGIPYIFNLMSENKQNKMPFFWSATLFDNIIEKSIITHDINLGIVNSFKNTPHILRQLSYKNQKVSDEEILSVTPGQTIRDVHFDNDQNIWVLTNVGIYLFDKNKKPQPINIPLVNKSLINSVIQDKHDGYWMATRGEGLFYIANINNITITENNSILNSDNIIATITDSINTIVATEAGDIAVIDNNSLKIKPYPFKKSIQLFYPRPNGRGFFIKSNEFTFEVNNDFEIKNKMSWDNIKSIIEVDDTIYLGAYGLHKIFKDANHQFPNDYTLDIDNQINYKIKMSYSIFKKNNDLYLGTLKGLFKNFNHIKFPIQPTLNQALIQDIKVNETDDDILWIATNQGLHGLKNDTLFQSFTTESGLVNNHCNHIQFDNKNQIWIGTHQGVNVINTQTGKVKTINSSNGLPSNRITSLSLNETQAWIGTPRGLVYFEQKEILKEKPLFPVSIINIQINRKDTILLDKYTLNYEDNSCVISFVSPSFGNEALTYHYRLVGLNSNWISTNSTSIPYTSLSSGNYQFEVYATDSKGQKSTINQNIQLVILQPFWEKWWFIAIGFIVVMSSVALAASLITRNYQKRREEKLNFQRELSESKIKALQSQMNPHFIFNALNAIQFFFTTNSKELAMLHLNKFAKLIRLIFEYSKETTITLQQEIKFLQLYLELEKLRFNKKIDFEYKIDDNLEIDAAIPPLLIQPIIENSFKHGLLHKEEKGLLKVIFQQKTASTIICIIEDDGIGRAAAKKYRKKWAIEGYRSSGVNTVEERIKLFNQNDNSVKIEMSIIDLEDKNGIASGTRTVFTFELDEAFFE